MLQQMFRDGCFLERIRSKELQPIVDRDRHPASLGHPWCTHSQFIIYVDRNGQEILRVHQYWREENRSLGGSGLPDPKLLVFNGQIYYTS